MQALLKVPDRRTPRGRIEHALLLFLYNTGARVSEATELVASDLQVGRRDGRHALVTIHGKGGKHRQCPLWPRTERALAELVHGPAANAAVFLSRQRRPYTRFGVYRLVERCGARVRGDSEPDTECAKNIHHRADARIALTGRATRNLTAFETADA